MRSPGDLFDAWRDRPVHYSRRLWTAILALGALPWPLGEELFAGAFAVSAVVRMRGFRRALVWASAQPTLGRRPWRVALSLCASNGRFIARSGLVGFRRPEQVERHVVVRGAEHLTTAGRAAVLLGFHLGPRNAYLALRAAGHAITWVGRHTTAAAWARPIRDRYHRRHHDLFPPREDPLLSEPMRFRLLYRARRVLLDGGHVFIGVDGEGCEAFVIELPGASLSVRSGWLALARAAAAPVLPALSHMEDRVQVVTLHPALPPPVGDPALHLEACRRILQEIVSEYVRRFPEQCPTLAFTDAARTRPGTGAP